MPIYSQLVRGEGLGQPVGALNRGSVVSQPAWEVAQWRVTWVVLWRCWARELKQWQVHSGRSLKFCTLWPLLTSDP